MILKTTDEILGHLERGDLAKDYAAEIHTVLEALSHVDDGSGSVTLKIKFAVKGEMVSAKAEITSTVPKKPRRSTSLFLTGDGRLSLQHPQQIPMFGESRSRRADIED